MLPYVYRITKYDPAGRDEHGSYVGATEAISDHCPVEDAYLRAVAAFAAGAGIDQLAIREPQAPRFVHFGPEPAVSGHSLTGLFPPGLSSYHDGATVPVAIGLELVRAMLRDTGPWCRLALDEEEGSRQRPADDNFWAQLHWSVVTGSAAILEECSTGNASRWHRLASDTLDGVRARLTPRARLTVWPDLSPDVGTVLAGLPDEGLVEFVWEDGNGQITSTVADETRFARTGRTRR